MSRGKGRLREPIVGAPAAAGRLVPARVAYGIVAGRAMSHPGGAAGRESTAGMPAGPRPYPVSRHSRPHPASFGSIRSISHINNRKIV